ncbi:hypothetical protein [Flagellimonas nanhaiensis]|uniref:Uncharacterized protein n=1 Tax=Flagellimonas nanhaiensis TaxID=2292706 RepID=A0A371JQM3_9FLAO|nr:hypothetical protein [Allomuricauda nanhaiensis]RDY59807.1 hypothetical protein DX873_10655 [Allomuricauda nanhaiensis]
MTTTKNGITKPNTLATHPFGILFYTLPHNFNSHAESKPFLDLSISSGNIWGQPVLTYVPSGATERERMQNIDFFSRTFEFDPSQSEHEFYSFQYDGVIKDIRLAYSFPLGKKSDIRLSTRSFLLTDGKFPFSTITSDQFIEYFHSNIAGGEDPFGRKVNASNQSGVNYVDRNGNTLDIKAGEFVFSGIEVAYYYYPSVLENHHIYLNYGLHVGTNLSAYNSSLDLGVSLAGIKKFNLRSLSELSVGLGVNLLRKSIHKFNTTQSDLGTSNYFGSFEGHFEYAIKNRTGGFHSFGLNYRIQTPYNNKKEEDYYVPFSEDRIARWHEAARHLYKFPSYWSLIYSFSKQMVISIYLQQDMLVNNTPDLQTGIQLRLPLSK